MANFDDPESEKRLIAECASDDSLDIILSSSNNSSDEFKIAKTDHHNDNENNDNNNEVNKLTNNANQSASAVANASSSVPHLLKFESNSFEYLYLLTLRIDISNSKIANIDLSKYYVVD